jgi:hypothetical protein
MHRTARQNDEKTGTFALAQSRFSVMMRLV